MGWGQGAEPAERRVYSIEELYERHGQIIRS